MNGVEIETDLMNLWIDLASYTKPKKKCIEMAETFDKMASWYEGIAASYQRKVEHYRNLQKKAKNAAMANRKLAAEAI